ncbi:MAG: YifB family Mg chelatase-like AAA ATPase [Thermoleophilaceae bacterium]
MLASVTTFALEGLDSREVTVEVDVRRGLPAFTLVGLPDASVREARERVRSALLNSGLDFPLQRITANLAPTSVRKAGPGFDLAIAVAVLSASGQVPALPPGVTALCGELSLSGALRPVRGVLAAAMGAKAGGYERLIVPEENAGEAALVQGLEVLAVGSLERLVDLMHGRWEPPLPPASVAPAAQPCLPDMADVRGQADAKRALEIAAAGGHHLLMVGPPGAGKTMVARRMPGILPPPSFDEALEITRVHSVAGLGAGVLAAERPFRAPHHTVSPQGLVGGGAHPRPGEVTLAHRGVLFLDELAEFARPALEALRQPLEDGAVEIMRGQRSLRFPAKAMFIAACNPCPCGLGPGRCNCSDGDRQRYQRRLSGPLMDRMDLVCQVAVPTAGQLVGDVPGKGGEPSRAIRARVVAARAIQRARLEDTAALCNGDMDARLTRRFCSIGGGSRKRLVHSIERGGLTGRGHDRVLRLARTIADLDGRDALSECDVEEALGYRVAAAERVAA